VSIKRQEQLYFHVKQKQAGVLIFILTNLDSLLEDGILNTIHKCIHTK